ncbi:TRAP transporter small permease [Saccharopolyspora sp. HNM0983]|uniref:TRAP transporter small permease n=1 Tax=Saccharopolyspora montiporae TaxID=2781240 RepID=A0A929FVZ3_9PSEU|nr:TRAP transporter small permease [Saccharopolyspora sp. HNM0983]MBE9372981.1 TRAP transporter small permease [Saccharopolyspora sp. HNM0983]
MRVLDGVRRAVLGCTRTLAGTAMLVIGLMMLTISYDVAARFLFAAPTDWAYPLNAVGVLAATALAAPHLYARGAHIGMDLVHRGLGPRAQRACDAATAVSALLLGVVLAVTGFRSMQVGLTGGLVGAGTFGIPLWIPDALLGIAGVLLAVVAVLFPPSAQDDPAGEADV